MSLCIAQKNAWSLARTLMVCITLFKAGSGYGVVPSAEFDGDPATVLNDYDPIRGYVKFVRLSQPSRAIRLAGLRIIRAHENVRAIGVLRRRRRSLAPA